MTPSVRWTSPPNTTMVLSDLGENMELRLFMRQEIIDTKGQARLASHKGMISLRELQSATGEELRPFFGRTLLPSVLDRAFKGEL